MRIGILRNTSASGGDFDGLSKNAQLIQRATGYDTDCVEGAAETLDELGIGELVRVRRAPLMSYTFKATAADGHRYYLEFGEYGYLEVVRADSIKGKVLWAVID